ncbi:hypothetical protein C8Q69DRAFT_290369 [Paecilomyces variotii]|uniref:Uncharacterized protein n=1 Tax=Byssochlamys spectabilis TaxID=264951 RepID=A0A443HRC9_BYSSP|nr:hypothetical protein C8Q69DRAFT_290369 [Paecilomyces variotii]RWQ94365.1 hypothetical protein C8Q69DRAFT_290369 [Paecilomyces variotii]
MTTSKCPLLCQMAFAHSNPPLGLRRHCIRSLSVYLYIWIYISRTPYNACSPSLSQPRTLEAPISRMRSIQNFTQIIIILSLTFPIPLPTRAGTGYGTGRREDLPTANCQLPTHALPHSFSCPQVSLQPDSGCATSAWPQNRHWQENVQFSGT